ncbi:MAG: LysM peptidoglycan-binding domain-containing protein, partial [Acidobacteria bacterium]|nr:LysM peptidoglycan-binding domain-containing protein [Acidobacteriota bacterium]
YQSALPDFPLAEIAPYDREMKAARLSREGQLQKTVVARVPPGRSRRHVAAPAPGIAPYIPQFRLEPVTFDAGLPPAPFAPLPPSDTPPIAPTGVERVSPVRVVLPTAADGSAVESGIPSVVRVERGDSLWKIAERHFGNGREWRRIAATNPQIANPDLIHAGEVLRLPAEVSGATAEADSVEGAAFGSPRVRVVLGDTLWALARTQFGHGTAWDCIAQANRLPNPDLILPGQTLTLPRTCR